MTVAQPRAWPRSGGGHATARTIEQRDGCQVHVIPTRWMVRSRSDRAPFVYQEHQCSPAVAYRPATHARWTNNARGLQRYRQPLVRCCLRLAAGPADSGAAPGSPGPAMEERNCSFTDPWRHADRRLGAHPGGRLLRRFASRNDDFKPLARSPTHYAFATLISIRVSSSGAVTMASWPVAISAQRHPCCAVTQLREACSAAQDGLVQAM